MHSNDRKRGLADIIAETERLILRTIEEGDAELQLRQLNSPTLMQFLGGPKELHEIEERHARTMALQAREGFGFLFVIEKETGELVGHCGLKRVDAEGAKNIGDFEIGWLIREDRWRRGYAGEAIDAVLEWAFLRHQAPYVVALTSDVNEPSWRLMEKLGMVRRKDLDFDDPRFGPEDNPTILYSLTREQWESAK